MLSQDNPRVTGAGCEICEGEVLPRELARGGSVGRCRECGHVVRSLADCPANHRAQAYGGDPNLDRGRLALTYRALTADGVPTSVFEIGFGTGTLLRRFADAGAAVAGVDSGQLGVAVDSEVAARGALWQGGIEDVPEKAQEVDLVYGVHVIEHVEEPMRALGKAGTLLRPGGRIVLLTPAADSWGMDVFGSAWWMLEDPTHVRFFSSLSLEQAARRAGFRSVRVDRLVLDSLTVDVASLARMVRSPGPEGALASRGVLGAGLLAGPITVALRLLSAKTRPTLRLTAEWPG